MKLNFALPLALRTHVVALFVLAYFFVCGKADGGVSSLDLACGLGFGALLQLGYLANKLYDREEDSYNGELLPVSGASGAWQAGLTAAFAVISLAMAAAAPRLIPVLLYSAAAAFAYSHPALRLKAYPVFKPLVNTLNFFLVSVMSPLLLAGAAGWGDLPQVLGSSYRLLLMVLCLTVLFDVRDARGDELAGLRTLPVLLGRARVLAVIAAVTLASGLGAVFAGRLALGAAQIVITGFALGAFKERGRRYYDVLVFIQLGFFALLLL